ncbi:MAG: hypothetical protein LBF55_05670 [Prevotellaceae bacterium]|nr:hypothetical protein [Prevotellaceae bacterium]
MKKFLYAACVAVMVSACGEKEDNNFPAQQPPIKKITRFEVYNEVLGIEIETGYSVFEYADGKVSKEIKCEKNYLNNNSYVDTLFYVYSDGEVSIITRYDYRRNAQQKSDTSHIPVNRQGFAYSWRNYDRCEYDNEKRNVTAFAWENENICGYQDNDIAKFVRQDFRYDVTRINPYTCVENKSFYGTDSKNLVAYRYYEFQVYASGSVAYRRHYHTYNYEFNSSQQVAKETYKFRVCETKSESESFRCVFEQMYTNRFEYY